MENGLTTESNSRLTDPAMIRLCLVPARQTGIASLCIQLIGLILSAALTVFLLQHISGNSMSRNIKHRAVRPTIQTSTINTMMVNLTELNSTASSIWDESALLITNENDTKLYDANETPVDLLELLQISTVVYIGLCILWLLSLMSLLASVKLESLDLIIVNSVLLTTVMIYVVIHALFVSILFIYYKHISWTTTLITSAVVFGLALTTVTCGFALAFNIIWYRYVVYINDNDQCQCLPMVVKFFKHRQHGQRTQEYGIPEATRHSHLPYTNEPTVQHFSHL